MFVFSWCLSWRSVNFAWGYYITAATHFEHWVGYTVCHCRHDLLSVAKSRIRDNWVSYHCPNWYLLAEKVLSVRASNPTYHPRHRAVIVGAMIWDFFLLVLSCPYTITIYAQCEELLSQRANQPRCMWCNNECNCFFLLSIFSWSMSKSLELASHLTVTCMNAARR